MDTVDNSTVAPTTTTQSNPSSEAAAAATQHDLTPAEAALTRIASNTKTSTMADEPAAVIAETGNVDHYDPSSLPPALIRRHSLPASLLVNNILSFWNGGDASSDNIDRAGSSQLDQQQVEPSHSLEQSVENSRSRELLDTAVRSSSTGKDTSALSGSSGTVNRHRYGHRHTKSAQLNQPVIVKTYNPPPESSEMGSRSIPKDWQKNRVELPSIESFSFTSILKAVEPQVNEAMDGVSEFFQDYRDKIKTETDVVDSIQNQIDARWKDLTNLSTSVEKAKKERTKKINSAASNLDYAVIDDLAQAADRSYSTLESIISTLLAIDELLPPSEQLTSGTSTHRLRYPKVCKLVSDKSLELLQHTTPSHRAPSTSPSRLSLQSTFTPTIAQTPSSPRFIIRYSEHDHDSAIELDSPPHTNIHQRRFSSSSSNAKTLGPRRTSLPPQVQLRTMVPEPISPNPSGKSPLKAFGSWANRPQTTSGVLPPGSPSSPTTGLLNRANSFGTEQVRRLSWSLGSLFSLRASPVVSEERPWGLEVPREDEVDTAQERLRRLIGTEVEDGRKRAKRRSMVY